MAIFIYKKELCSLSTCVSTVPGCWNGPIFPDLSRVLGSFLSWATGRVWKWLPWY